MGTTNAKIYFLLLDISCKVPIVLDIAIEGKRINLYKNAVKFKLISFELPSHYSVVSAENDGLPIQLVTLMFFVTLLGIFMCNASWMIHIY